MDPTLIYFSGMPQVTLLRHAESMANVANTMGKEPINMYDAPLSDEGKQQASRVTGHYDVVLCSPMRRTRETLQNSSITYDKLVRATRSLSFYFIFPWLKGTF